MILFIVHHRKTTNICKNSKPEFPKNTTFPSEKYTLTSENIWATLRFFFRQTGFEKVVVIII